MAAHLSSMPWLPRAHSTHSLARLPLGTGGTLGDTCGRRPAFACRLMWDLTHDRATASAAGAYLAGPVTLVLRIAFVLAVALVTRLVAHRMISKLTQRAADAATQRPDAGIRARGERRHQRAQAIGSLLRNMSSVVIFGIAGVTIAGYLGLNLAPVLASAGVLGLAIGFGAQSLVRDFISGIFMLLEDQYGVGDVINAGEATGTVEAVSLRTTRLRDVNGVVWHIRNGTINRIGNQSQGWSRAVIDFPVPYQQDLALVRTVMRRTAGQLRAEPRWQEVILEEPEVWGAESVYSDAVVMRLVAKTLPMRQWEVARELRERLKTALDLPGDAAGPAIAATDGAAGPASPAAASASPSPAAAPTPASPAAAPGPGSPAAAPGPGSPAAADPAPAFPAAAPGPVFPAAGPGPRPPAATAAPKAPVSPAATSPATAARDRARAASGGPRAPGGGGSSAT